MQNITYTYSKTSSIIFTIVPSAMILMSVPQLIKFINAHNSTNWILILIFDGFIMFMLLYIVIKQLIPALRNKIALELNETDLVSYTKNVTVKWKNVKDIRLIIGKSSSALELTFKWETDHGNYIRIPLGFVAGSDDKIYNTALSYLKNSK